jgi:hypothetical protein
MAERTRAARAARARRARPAEEELEALLQTPPRELEAPRRPREPRRAGETPAPRGVGAGLATELRGRAALRRAVLLQEILGPPVALRDEER